MRRLLSRFPAAICAAIVPIALLLATVAGPYAGEDGAGTAMQSIRPESIRGEMRFLSDDLLEGRAGSWVSPFGSQLPSG